MATELILAKRELAIKERQQYIELLKELLSNKAMMAIGGCVLCEALQRVKVGYQVGHDKPWWSRGWFEPPVSGEVYLISQPIATAIETGLVINLAGGIEQVSKGIGLLTTGILGLLSGAIPK